MRRNQSSERSRDPSPACHKIHLHLPEKFPPDRKAESRWKLQAQEMRVISLKLFIDYPKQWLVRGTDEKRIH